jgi:hypothetical protein
VAVLLPPIDCPHCGKEFDVDGLVEQADCPYCAGAVEWTITYGVGSFGVEVGGPPMSGLDDLATARQPVDRQRSRPMTDLLPPALRHLPGPGRIDMVPERTPRAEPAEPAGETITLRHPDPVTLLRGFRAALASIPSITKAEAGRTRAKMEAGLTAAERELAEWALAVPSPEDNPFRRWADSVSKLY